MFYLPSTSTSPHVGQSSGVGSHTDIPHLFDAALLDLSFELATSIDPLQFDFDALVDSQYMDESVIVVNHMAAIPDLASESIMDHQMLPEDHHFQNQGTSEEVLDALDEVSKKAEAADSLADHVPMSSEPTVQDVGYEQTTSTSETVPTSTLGTDHVESITAMPDAQDYIAFDDPEGEDTNVEETHPVLDENDIAGLVKDLARDMEAEMDTDPSVGHSIADPELTGVEFEVVPEQTVIETEPAPAAPVIVSEQPAEPLRRMDDETIPVTVHNKDSIIGILDDAPQIAAADAINVNDANQQSVEDETMSFEEPPKVPEDEITPADAPTESPESKAIYLQHIQVVEQNGSVEEAEMVGTNDEVVAPVQVAVEDIVAEEGLAIVETEGLSVPSAMEAEPISAVSTEFAIEHDPALEMAAPATNETNEEASLPADPPVEPDPALPEMETVVTTTTTTVTTVIETEPEIEQPSIGAGADADADTNDDQAEHMRRAEQTRLEQVGSDMAEQQEQQQDVEETIQEQPNDETEATTAEPTEEVSAPKDDEPTLSEQLENGQEVTAGPIDPAIVSDPTLNPPNGDLSPRAPQYSIALDAPSVVAPPGMFSASKSPEWQGFAALNGEHDLGSPEPADHSSETHEESPNDVESKDISAMQPVSSAGASTSANPSRKRKLIMEVVIPVSSKGKSKAIKAESPVPAARGRPTSKTAGSARSGSTSKSRPRSRSSGRRKPASVSSGSPHRSSAEPTPEKAATTQTRQRASRRSFNARPRKAKKPGKPTPVDHIARSTKVEVVMQKRPGLLRRTGSIPSGNNVKFAPTTRASRKRKAESEPDEVESDHQAQSSDADAEGEVEEGYEDVEEDEESEPEPAPEPVRKAGPSKPVKRPRRSLGARKPPTKLPEVLTESGRPKKRRVRR